MMLSNRAKYATRALVELSLNYDRGPVAIPEIAQRQNIPVKFLEQILFNLKLMGFVQSKKGPGGGYFLSRSPREVILGDVVRAMDGPVAPISCVSVYGYQECGCPDPETCGLKRVFKEARDAIANVLDSTSFADVIQVQTQLEALSEEPPALHPTDS